jgi:hypothetical protein
MHAVQSRLEMSMTGGEAHASSTGLAVGVLALLGKHSQAAVCSCLLE